MEDAAVQYGDAKHNGDEEECNGWGRELSNAFGLNRRLVRMIERGDGFDYAVLFFVGEFRVNRQGENFEAGFLGDGKLAGLVAQMFERVLQVQAEGVIDF